MGLAVRILALVGLAVTALAQGNALAQRKTVQVQNPAASSAPASVTAPKPDTPATVIDDQEVEGILGKGVRGSAGEDMGRIVDILVNRTGQMRAAIIDFGGFLGVGSRKIAVDWSALRFPESGKLDRVTLDLTRNQLRLAPEYRPGEPVVVLGRVTPQTEGLSPRSEK
jgi:hypothetical protein